MVTSVRREVRLRPFHELQTMSCLDPIDEGVCRGLYFLQVPSSPRHLRICGLSTTQATPTRSLLPGEYHHLLVFSMERVQGFLGSDANGRKLEIGPMTGSLEVDVPEGLICQAMKLPERQKSDSEELEINTFGVYIDVMSPLPEEIQQNELQRMMFRDTLHAIIPYPAEVQYTIVRLRRMDLT